MILKKNTPILLLYAYPETGNASTISEHALSFSRYSKHLYVNVNVLKGLPTRPFFQRFKNIVLHYSLFDAIPMESLAEVIDKDSHSIVAFFQDEYQKCRERYLWIETLGVKAVYTLLTPEDFETVYGGCESVEHIEETLTGYVDDALIKKADSLFKPTADREIDIGYRARKLPFYMGKGAQEKGNIADIFEDLSITKHLRLDLDTKERNRLYGEDWYLFLANCKAMLGVEAGTSIFDLNGDIEEKCFRYTRDNPQANFDMVHDAILKDHEGAIYYRMVSPRVFECAAFKVLMVMFEGNYTNVLRPYEHYIPLKKDFSNIEEAMRLLNDDKKCQEIVECAHQELILSSKYSYRVFIKGFDAFLEKFRGVEQETRLGVVVFCDWLRLKTFVFFFQKRHRIHFFLLEFFSNVEPRLNDQTFWLTRKLKQALRRSPFLSSTMKQIFYKIKVKVLTKD